MRYVLGVVLASVLLVAALEAFAWTRPTPSTVELLGIAAPHSLAPGEKVAVYGGLRVPQGTYELGLWTCSSGVCRRTSWIRITGPTTVWRWLGTEDAPNDKGQIVMRLYDVSSPYCALVGEWRQHVIKQ